MKIKYWMIVAFIVGIVSLAMPVTACVYNHNPIFASYLNGCAFGCTSAQDGDADYSTTYSYDFAARHQNSAFPHFTTPDPLAEKFKHLSPHLFCAGDPINLIDPTGMKWLNADVKGRLLEILNDRLDALNKKNRGNYK